VNWCFGSHRCCGAFVAPPQLRPTFLRSKQKLCENAGLRFRKGHTALSFAHLRAPFLPPPSNMQELVHGLIGARELRRNVNLTVSTILAVILPAQPAN